jgi:putative oxidoreductase
MMRISYHEKGGAANPWYDFHIHSLTDCRMETLASLHTYSDWGLLALRLALGASFLMHGLMKHGMWKSGAATSVPAGLLAMFRLFSIVEPLGGAALILGFLTQLAALGLGLIMIGAISVKISRMNMPYSSDSVNGWEFDLVNLAVCVMLFLTGAGAFSLDSMI